MSYINFSLLKLYVTFFQKKYIVKLSETEHNINYRSLLFTGCHFSNKDRESSIPNGLPCNQSGTTSSKRSPTYT